MNLWASKVPMVVTAQPGLDAMVCTPKIPTSFDRWIPGNDLEDGLPGIGYVVIGWAPHVEAIKRPAIYKGNNNPTNWGRKRSPWFLTTYRSWDDPPSLPKTNSEFTPGSSILRGDVQGHLPLLVSGRVPLFGDVFSQWLQLCRSPP